MQKYVQLQDLLAGLPQSGNMTTTAARRLAHDIIDACEAVDPTEEESEWERYAAQQAREMVAETTQAGPAPTSEADPGELAKAINAGLGSRGLAVRKPSPHCLQVMQGHKVFAEWWPSRGTTRANNQRGPKCYGYDDVVRWLRTLV